MGEEKSGILSHFMDTNKLFNMPINFNKRKIIFGEYSPANDAMSILMDTKNLKYKEIPGEMANTNNMVLKAGGHHENFGHLQLTKLSSFWILYSYKKFNSYLLFRDILNTSSNSDKVDIELLATKIKKLLIKEAYHFALIQAWRPVQEAIAISLLIAMKKTERNPEAIDDLDSIIEINKNDSEYGLIGDFTDRCEHVLNEFGARDGWHLLANMAAVASSPKISLHGIPKKPEDFEKNRIEQSKRNREVAKKMFRVFPIERFHKMLELTTEHPKGIKKLMKNNIRLYKIATWIANDSELEVEPAAHTFHRLYRYCTDISINKKMSINIRNSYGLDKQYLEILAEIGNDAVNPTFLFIKDITTDNIFFYQLKRILDRWLRNYLQTNILIDQFLESLKEERDGITCFDHKLHFCKKLFNSKCEKCGLYKNLYNSQKLYERVHNNISYRELFH